MRLLIGFVCVALATSGCVSMTDTRKQLSAGQVGCGPDQIDISEESNYTWVSTCAGKRYQCSSTGMGAACRQEQYVPSSQPGQPANSPASPTVNSPPPPPPPALSI